MTPNAQPVDDQWVNLYTYFSIEVGKQLLVNCRGNHSIYLAESDVEPSQDHFGVELYPTRQLIVDIDSVGVWARSSKGKPSAVIVQEDLINGN